VRVHLPSEPALLTRNEALGAGAIEHSSGPL
jgi:hypothetical protein